MGALHDTTTSTFWSGVLAHVLLKQCIKDSVIVVDALQAPDGKGEVAKASPWAARMRYAKIGGAAVAGGAILAVTGELIGRGPGHN